MHNPPRLRELEDHIIKTEGGFVDDPLDVGGVTNYGITKPALADYLGVPVTNVTDQMIADLSEEDARTIYRVKWITHPRIRADLLHDHDVAMIVVDSAVLFGRERAAKWVQEICGVAQDGVIGTNTRAAMLLVDPRSIVFHIVRARTVRHARVVRANPTQVRFLEGWLTRALQFLSPDEA